MSTLAITAQNTSPTPVDTVAPAVDDRVRYLDTLREIGVHGASVNAALLEAHLADGPQARTDALSTLHHRIRAMAALTNHALGGWPEPSGDQEPQ